MRMAAVRARREEACVRGAVGLEALDEFRTDFVVRLPDHRAGRGDDVVARRRRSFSIARDGRLDHAGERAAPAGMRGADHARAARRRTGSVRSPRSRRRSRCPAIARDQRVGARPRVRRPRLLDGHHVRRMDLIGGEEIARARTPSAVGHQRAVLGDMRRRIARADAAVEAFVDAARHAALAREEGVADARQRCSEAAWSMARCRHPRGRRRPTVPTRLSVTPALAFEAGQLAELRVGERDRLEQLAHAGALARWSGAPARC